MLISNLINVKKKSKVLFIIQLSIIFAYHSFLTKTQDMQKRNRSPDSNNPIENLNELIENNKSSTDNLNNFQNISLNKNTNLQLNTKQNLLFFFSKIKSTISTFIMTNNNNNNNLISFATITSQLNSKTILNCEANPKLKSLVISTNFHPNSDEFNIDIFRDCEINQMWRSRNVDLKSCESPKRAIEGEDNIRRAFRFSYLAPPYPTQSENSTDNTIVISKMILEFPKSAAESTLTKSKLTLHPGDVTDIYLNYNCKNTEESRLLVASHKWYSVKFLIEFANGGLQSFEFIKVCNASYSDSVDISHFFILSFIFLVAHLSTKDFLKSRFEVIIVEKYTEMRNPENLLLISLVVSLILIFLGVIGYFAAWTTLVVIILAPISIAMIGEALLTYHDTLTQLESRSYEIPFIGSISFLFSLCLGVGLLLVTLFFYTENWILNNLIAVALALITIRLFKFTNFKLILIMFSLRFFYDLIWSHYYSQYFSENFRLSNNSQNHLPIKFLCPEFAVTPFNSCNFLPIADIIMPGILCTYAKIFDESKGINLYFVVANASLIAGLFLNMFVYYSYKLPLPSFLFSGPLMILTMIVIAHNTGHLQKLVEGFSSTLLENNLDKNIKKISFQQKMKSGVQYVPPKI